MHACLENFLDVLALFMSAKGFNGDVIDRKFVDSIVVLIVWIAFK